jgi:hypothetical protein
MATIEDMLPFLDSKATDLYGPRPIPCDIDQAVREFVEAIAQSDEETRSTIFALMNEQHGFVLLAFAERMAAYAVRKQDPSFLAEGLTALAFAYRLVYWKEVIPILSLVFRSAQKLGVDETKVLSLPPAADASFARMLREFMARDPQTRDIKDMGYIESSDEGTFRYARTW